jgi:hypothetical protein
MFDLKSLGNGFKLAGKAALAYMASGALSPVVHADSLSPTCTPDGPPSIGFCVSPSGAWMHAFSMHEIGPGVVIIDANDCAAITRKDGRIWVIPKAQGLGGTSSDGTRTTYFPAGESAFSLPNTKLPNPNDPEAISYGLLKLEAAYGRLVGQCILWRAEIGVEVRDNQKAGIRSHNEPPSPPPLTFP